MRKNATLDLTCTGMMMTKDTFGLPLQNYNGAYDIFVSTLQTHVGI